MIPEPTEIAEFFGNPVSPVLVDKFNTAFQGAMEAAFDISQAFIDPEERFVDSPGGERWRQIGMDSDPEHRSTPFLDEEQLAFARNQSRLLSIDNEYAINGHENRINYVVGTGHTYTAVSKEDKTKKSTDDTRNLATDQQVAEVQEVIDAFVKDAKWHSRQQEIVRRKDRDGECFLRFFVRDNDGMLLVRFVEPEQVSTPQDAATDPSASWGIKTAPDDVETVEGYYIDKKLVPAIDIQHRKLGTDANVKRGIPLFYPCRADLHRVDKIQRNMAVMSTTQSAIAMIRKHANATTNAVQQMVQNAADVQTVNPYTKNPAYHTNYGAGTILDAPKGIEYDFPNERIRPDAFVPVRDAIIRTVASRLVMPEFMLSSDASNANYSSTMVAEGPAVKQFSRLQADMIEDDRAVMEMALAAKVVVGQLTQEAVDAIEIDVQPPRLETRDRLKDAQADKVLVDSKAMSPQTMSVRHDLDPDKEQQLIDEMREKNDPFAGMDVENPLFGQPGRDQPNRTGDGDDEDKDDEDED